MNTEFYNQYFEGLAAGLKDISHNATTHKAFYIIDEMDNLAEVNEALRSTIKFPALLLENFEDELTDGGYDSNREKLSGAFAVIMKIGQKQPVEGRRLIRDQARAIGRKLIFKMRADSRDGVLADAQIMIKVQSKGFAVGPVADGCYGWRYTFLIEGPVNGYVDPNDWQDTPAV